MNNFINYLHGNDRLLILRQLNELIKKLKLEKNDIIKYDLKEDKEAVIFEELITVSIFSNAKVVIIDNFEHILSFEEHVVKRWLNFFSQKNEHIYLFLIGSESFFNKSDNILKSFLKNINIIKVEEITEKNAKVFIKSELKKNGFIINDITTQKIIDKVKFDFSKLTLELEKLSIYCSEVKKIENKDVEDVISFSYDDSIYAMLDLILSKNKTLLIECYMNLVKNDFDHLRILFSINSALKNLFYAKIMLKEGYSDINIQKELNLTAGSFYYLTKNITKVSLDFLEENLLKIADIDFDIKNGKINKNDAVDLFILRI